MVFVFQDPIDSFESDPGVIVRGLAHGFMALTQVHSTSRLFSL